MKIFNINGLNLILILLSFTLACFFPFELFLLSYAILGPLHYLTETNWVRDKGYFVNNTYWKYIVLIAAILYSVPFIFRLPLLSEHVNKSLVIFIKQDLSLYSNVLLCSILFCSFIVLLNKKIKGIIIGFLITVLVSLSFYKTDLYILVIGILLPSIIHVYVFTILFMVYGLKKDKNKLGLINVILMFLLPLLLFFIDPSLFNYEFTQFVKEKYTNNNFHLLNAHLSKMLGIYEDLRFFFYEKIDLKIQIFITFSYVYHYLNWFSKTTVIGWHKKITTQKTIIILAIWVVILGCYLYDYKLGLIVSIFLSITHVMLEFPLNMLTIKSLFKN